MPTPFEKTALELVGPEQMETLGQSLGQHCPVGQRIYLKGDLGAGKTTLVRGFLRGRGYQGKVKSPTYTLVEPYELDNTPIFHFDLYRMMDEEELIHIGFQDYLQEDAIVLLEWPEKAATLLQTPDLLIEIEIVDNGRKLLLSANNAIANQLLADIRPGN